MAISTKKKNIIIAMWKTGNYKSFTSIAKHYKISTKTAQKIIGDSAHENEDIIETGVKYEMAKKSIKNPHEINAIEKVVSDRIKIDTVTNKILDKVDTMLDKGTKQVVVKVKEYSKTNGSSESLDTIDQELDTQDLKNLIEATDKASLTLGVNQRHAQPTKIDNTNAQIEQKVVKIEYS